MDARTVMKFGGAALADGEAIRRVCRLVRERGGERPLVVVSAHAGVTELLDAVAHAAADGDPAADAVRVRHRSILAQLALPGDLLDRYLLELSALLAQVKVRGRLAPGERDYILSYGERMSARVVAHALRAEGVVATPVDAFDLGLVTESRAGGARPLPGVSDAIRAALEEVPGVAVVTGFLARDREGNLTTLGRNGSDLTASLLGEAVGAAEVQFWKTVGGVMTADPRLVPEARTLERLSYAAAAEYAFHGAQVLHPSALEPAQRAGLVVRVLDASRPDAPGTRLVSERGAAGPLGVASQSGVAELAHPLGSPAERAAELAFVFETLARFAIEPRLVSVGGDRVRVVVLPRTGVEGALEALGPRATLERELAVVALVGHGVGRDHRLGLAALELFGEAGVEVREAFTGSRLESQAFLVARRDLERAVVRLHAAFLAPVLGEPRA